MTVREIELKRCPFCGGRAEVFIAHYSKRITIWCVNPDCGVKPFTMYVESLAEAVAAWNSRNSSAEKLREALVEIKDRAIDVIDDDDGTYRKIVELALAALAAKDELLTETHKNKKGDQ